MKRTAACLSALLVLSSCGNPAANVSRNAAAATGLVAMRPGKYEIDFVREETVPGQPSEPMHDTEQQCLTADDLRYPEAIFVPPSDSCTKREAKASKGEFSAEMVCNSPEFGASDFVLQVHGTYDADGAELTGDANLDGATLHETRTFRRQGDC